MREVENEKQVRSQDTKVNQALEELRGRCKGYYGQLYELVKSINAQYDVAVKVALSKCLKYLVVDSPQTAQYCTDFLREKGLFKELLVLSNVPDRKQAHSAGQVSKDSKGEAHLVMDIIEVSRLHAGLEKGVRYFVGDKIVCRDFDTAVKLQSLGYRDIVTSEGTEFKAGMISGGQHKNIFAVNLGQLTLDRDIRKLADEISILQKGLAELDSEG